ncbi:MAG: 3-hydroxybutyrate dehydrogenase [Alphaproteobacteria bacterium]|nr:3-hydroxybutyrate dehydrogenase [Alphaproteobacteria bacterium]
MSLKGKTAIVTGSTSGIGLGIAHALAGQGTNILLNGFGDAGEIQKLKESLAKQYGVKVEYSAADMSKPAEIRDMATLAEKTFGGVDVLVNNAGIQFTAPVEEFPDDKWDAIIAINLSAAFHGIKAVIPGMKKKGWGRIINIASVHGLVASANKAAYVAAKHGIVGLTKVVALENATLDITCNAICPGWVHTPLVQKQIEDKAKVGNISVDEAQKRLLGEKQPSQRFVKPEQLGELVVFLCGPAGSGFTGAALNVDGGWMAQ